MSEPTGNDDIEDVVSSVRRLVSPEARPRPMSRDLGMDRLILTPALRIVAEQTANGPTIVKLETVVRKARPKARKTGAPDRQQALSEAASPDRFAKGVGESSAASLSGMSLAEMVLGAEEAEIVFDRGTIPDLTAKSSVPPEGNASDLAVPAPKDKTTGSATDSSKRKRGAGTATVGTRKARSATTTKTASSGKAASAKPEDRRPGRAKVSASGRSAVRPKGADASPGATAGRKAKAASGTPAKGAGLPRLAPKTGRMETPTLLASGAAGTEEEVIAKAAEDPVPGPAADAFPEIRYDSGDGFSDSALDTVPQATDEPSAATPELVDANGNAISLLDEAGLIALVRQVLREELQGELGERITRNVRKLVRAEVARMLTSETLE